MGSERRVSGVTGIFVLVFKIFLAVLEAIFVVHGGAGVLGLFWWPGCEWLVR